MSGLVAPHLERARGNQSAGFLASKERQRRARRFVGEGVTMPALRRAEVEILHMAGKFCHFERCAGLFLTQLLNSRIRPQAAYVIAADAEALFPALFWQSLQQHHEPKYPMSSLPSTTHIFIDYENRKVADFSRAAGKPVRIYLIIGPQDTKLPISVSLFLQDYPDQLRIIQSPRIGHNAADRVLARELGKVAAEDLTGRFHIISKDADYDIMVQCLLGQKRSIARYDSLEKVPALGSLPKDRFVKLNSHLRNPGGNRPKTRAKLESWIQSYYGNTLSPEDLENILLRLSDEGVVSFSEEGQTLYPAVITKFSCVA